MTTPETRPARPDTPIDKNEIIKRFVEEDRKRADRETAHKEGSARTLEVVLRKRRKLNKDFTPITREYFIYSLKYFVCVNVVKNNTII